MQESLRLVTAEPEEKKREAAIAARLMSESGTNVPMLKVALEGSGATPSAWTMLSTLGVSKIILTVAACRDEFTARRRRTMKEPACCPLTLKLI